MWKAKRASGVTAVQMAWKEKDWIVKIKKLGSAHSREELEIILAMARKKLHENQLELFPETPSSAQLGLKQSYLGLL